MPRKTTTKKKTGVRTSGPITDAVMNAFEKKFGHEAVANDLFGRITDFISTQCFVLDAAMGGRGFGLPCGRMTALRGRESAGKSAVATHAAAECQRRGGHVVYIDSEYAYDWDHAADLGLYDADHMDQCPYENAVPAMPVYVDHIEDAYEKMEFLMTEFRTQDPDGLMLVVFDSVAGCAPKAEVEGKYDQVFPGLPARLHSHGLRKIGRLVSEKRICLLYIEQPKEKMQMGGPPMAKGGRGGEAPTDTLAGRPIGFHATVKLEIARVNFVGENKASSIGIVSKVKVIKNKMGAPFRECEFPIMYGYGIDNDRCTFDFALEHKVLVKQSGGRYHLRGDEEVFKKSDWPEVACHDEAMSQLQEIVAEARRVALAKKKDRKAKRSFDADVNDAAEDADEAPPPRKTKKHKKKKRRPVEIDDD